MGVRSSLCALIAVGYLGAVGASGAIVQHVGANNPETENWTLNFAGDGHVTGPIINDAGTGYDAWEVNDNTSGHIWYFHNFTSVELTSLAGKNWIAAARLRQPTPYDRAADGDVLLDVHFGTKRFLAYFGTQADGNPTWALLGKPLAALPNLGSGYHLFEFRYDAATTTADFYVDGQLAFDDFAGTTPNGAQRIVFGSGAGAPTDGAHYNLVTMTLDPIPEPAALSLLSLGGLILGRRRR